MPQIRISDFIRVQREALLSEWEAAARTLPRAQALDRPSLDDNMPQMLSSIVDWIERGNLDDLSAIEQLAGQHAGQRLRNGLDLRQVVAEYRILRVCILRRLTEQFGRQGQSGDELDFIGRLDEVIDSIRRLDEAIDAAIAGSVDRLSTARERAARDADLQLDRILATLPIAVFVADADGNLNLSNAAARRLWGGEHRVPLEQYNRFKAWWPDGRRLASDDWGLSRALRRGEVTVDEELEIEGFDGSRKIIRNSAAPIVDDSGRIVGGVAVNEDITLLKRAEATRDLFLGILGHDLRNPLNAITMAVFLLLKREGLEKGGARRGATPRADAHSIERRTNQAAR